MRLFTKAAAVMTIAFASVSAQAADQSFTGDGTVMLSVWQEGVTSSFGDAASVIIDTGLNFSDLFAISGGGSISVDVNSIFDVNTFFANNILFPTGEITMNIVAGARNGGFNEMFSSKESFVNSAINVELNNSLNNYDNLFINQIGASGAETSTSTTSFPNAFNPAQWNDNFGTAFQDIDNAFEVINNQASGEMMLFQTSTQGTLNGQPLQVNDFGGLYTFAYDLATGNLEFSAVPLPAAVWFLGSALIGLMGFSRRRATAA